MPKLSRPRARLLDLLLEIEREQTLSRGDVAARTGYSSFLVSRMCDELLRRGFVRETGTGSSTGGRPPTLLSVNPKLGRLVGVHIGTVNVRIVITDMAGKLLHYEKSLSRVETGPAEGLEHIATRIEAAIQKTAATDAPIRGMGIGISGVLDRETGSTLYWPKVPQWSNVPVKQFFVARFGTVVELEDTPRTMALAERRYGRGGRVQSFLYVMVGAGVGAAMHLNGDWYTGANGFAGEFGHLTVAENGPLCSCGSRGCVESLVSATALIRRTRQAVRQNLALPLWRLCQGNADRISVEQIVQAADEGDRFCSEALERAGMYLGLGLVGLINLLNPALLILGGGMAQAAGRFLLPAAQQVLQKRAVAQSAAGLEIRLSSLEESDWARGAALLVSRKALANTFEEGTPAT